MHFSQPVDLAVDATGIYWGQNNELLRLTAGSRAVIYTSPKQSQENVHVDANAIYWVDTTSGPSTASIMSSQNGGYDLARTYWPRRVACVPHSHCRSVFTALRSVVRFVLLRRLSRAPDYSAPPASEAQTPV
jgi:hypothetical protein